MATIVLAGGGTGGHVYPAIAIGDVLRERGHRVLYYGDANRLEGRVAPERGYVFRPLNAAQFPRRGVLGKLRFAVALLVSIWRTRALLQADEVDLVLGVGGYLSAPPVLAAWTLGRGRAIHEANVVPGLANKLCARVAQRVFLTYEKTRSRLPGDAPKEVVGVPVNPKVIGVERTSATAYYGLESEQPIVLFVGGSLGAARLNELAVAVGQAERSFQVLHITGPRYYDAIMEQLGGSTPDGWVVKRYEDQMGQAYAAAQLVVCRAGSSTLAELTAVGVGSLLIPSPNVTENHQEENARGLEEVGAAEVLLEADWDLDRAVRVVTDLMKNVAQLGQMASAAASAARLDAACRAADGLETLL